MRKENQVLELSEMDEEQKKRRKQEKQRPAEPRRKARAAKPKKANPAKRPQMAAEEPDGMTEKEQCFRRVLARLEAEAPKAKEALRQLIARQIEELRRERVGEPPLETVEEREERLRKTIEEAWKRPESETPKAEHVQLHRFTLEEAERNVKRFDWLIEQRTHGPEKGTPEEIANLEGGRDWFQKTVEERKREAEAEASAATEAS